MPCPSQSSRFNHPDYIRRMVQTMKFLFNTNREKKSTINFLQGTWWWLAEFPPWLCINYFQNSSVIQKILDQSNYWSSSTPVLPLPHSVHQTHVCLHDINIHWILLEMGFCWWNAFTCKNLITLCTTHLTMFPWLQELDVDFFHADIDVSLLSCNKCLDKHSY